MLSTMHVLIRLWILAAATGLTPLALSEEGHCAVGPGTAMQKNEALSRDKTGTNGVQENKAGSQVLYQRALASRGSLDTERTGLWFPADSFRPSAA